MATSASINTAYIILTGVLLISATSVFVVLQPLGQDIQSVRENIQENNLTLQEKEEFLRTIDRKISALQAQRDQENRLQVVLPARDRVEDVLRIIQDAANKSGVVVRTTTNDSGAIQAQLNAQRSRGEKVAIPTTVQVQLIELKVQGTYQQTRAFISEIERSPRLMDIQRMDIHRNSNQQDIVELNASIRFYSQQPLSNTPS